MTFIYIQGLFFFLIVALFYFIAQSTYIRFLARHTKLYSVMFPLHQKACISTKACLPSCKESFTLWEAVEELLDLLQLLEIWSSFNPKES